MWIKEFNNSFRVNAVGVEFQIYSERLILHEMEFFPV